MYTNASIIKTKSNKDKKPYNMAEQKEKGNKPKRKDKRQAFDL